MAQSKDEVSLEALAVLKILLHAAKHPDASVVGILLGPASSKGDSVVDDAMPLFHHTTATPLFETAFLLVEEHARREGKRLAGYYYCPVSTLPEPSNGSPAQAATGVADKIHEHYPGAVLVKLNSRKLANADENPLEVYTRSSANNWTQSPASASAEGLTAFNRVMTRFDVMASLIDVDDHLDNAKEDFRNPHIAKLLSSE